MNPLVSIVILNYNGKRFMQRCLESVLADGYYPREVILVDNASEDGSMQLAEPFADRITIILNSQNYGFPKGCNAGIRGAKGEYIVLLNIDTEVTPGWLEALIQPMIHDARIGAAASKLLFPDRSTVQFAGGCVHPNGLTSHDGYGIPDHGQFDTSKECGYVTGASVALRVSALEAVGGLDEGFPLYFEDVDLCARMHQAGYKVIYEPRSVVYHYETFGTRKFSFAYFYKFHRGRMRFILKNFGVRYFFTTFIPAELRWYRACDFSRQCLPLFCAYFTQMPKALYFWMRGFTRRRSSAIS